MSPIQIEQRTPKAFLIAAFLQLFIAITISIALWNYQNSLNWVTHANSVIHTSDSLLESIDHAQTTVREYNLINRVEERDWQGREEALLKKYTTLVAQVKTTAAVLQKLTSENAQQQHIILSILSPELDKMMVRLDIAIHDSETRLMTKAEANDPKRRLKISNKLRQEARLRNNLYDNIWSSVHAVEDNEQNSLGDREQGLRYTQLIVICSIAFALLISIGLLVWAQQVVDYHEKRHEAAIVSLANMNDTLEDQVSARTSDLREINQQLRRMNAEMDLFAHVASHDLQEPLRTVSAYVSMLKRSMPELDSRRAIYLTYIVEGVLRMQNLVRDVRNYTQVGAKSVVMSPTDLNVIVADIVTSHDVLIRDTLTEIVVPVPLPILEIDRTKVTRIFSNLIHNSITFRKPGVAPRIEITATLDENRSWVLAIKDNGMGFNQNFAAQIFNIFERLRPSERDSGTGLGLAVCKKLVELHHGKIWATAKEGEGATFFFTLTKNMNES